MSLYHETASLLLNESSVTHGGSLKSRVFGTDSKKLFKSPPAQVYALALESSKWSSILKEVIENSELLKNERKVTPALAVLLVHDHLLAKGGIALPTSHGLRAAIERHKARLASEFTKARLRRKCPTVEALREEIVEKLAGPVHPRWVRVNSVKSTLDKQLETTFKGFQVVSSVGEVMSAGRNKRVICLDGHVPNLIACPPGLTEYLTKSDAYKKGEIILQDKASCFPAYLLDARPEDGDIIDACSAPGNKTTHLAGILAERGLSKKSPQVKIHAFEKDKNRAKTLEKMVSRAGSDTFTTIHPGEDFLRSDPHSPEFAKVTALLLDPSCSGSGIVGRDDTPELHLPDPSAKPSAISSNTSRRKRKRPEKEEAVKEPAATFIDDDDNETVLSSQKDLQTRIEALAAFQLLIILHAFAFPAAKRVTYSTCSIYAGENEHVVLKALSSPIAKQRGWRILRREEQVRGMHEWEVRGDKDACELNQEVADGCIRAFRDDGRGVMGFFVAAFVRDGSLDGEAVDEDGPYRRDDEGRIVRDDDGIPTLKSTGRKAVEGEMEEVEVDVRYGKKAKKGKKKKKGKNEEVEDDEGPFLRDEQGRIVRDGNGMPTLKSTGETVVIEESGSEDGWGGFDD
ncbi:S-adenosyl-L-methionine-dependent methyltransferase [Podospora australis]|uniref:S-adenosyl-L-methionine-dependent methyltransferase n=1 Tax=Podospora australis TaxID=1536484 RepID=A0AAN6X128_9PEZI|nr:S-adenosyl-L-methionine-dependent methyltransferase [Podospora australis]